MYLRSDVKDACSCEMQDINPLPGSTSTESLRPARKQSGGKAPPNRQKIPFCFVITASVNPRNEVFGGVLTTADVSCHEKKSCVYTTITGHYVIIGIR